MCGSVAGEGAEATAERGKQGTVEGRGGVCGGAGDGVEGEARPTCAGGAGVGRWGSRAGVAGKRVGLGILGFVRV